MPTSRYVLSVALFGFSLGLTVVYALDGTRSPVNVAPPVGVGVAPEVPSVGGSRNLREWARAMRAGDNEAALKSLEEAAFDGDVMALWKLGRMYADGDGVKQNDLRAFEYFRALADSQADEVPCSKPAVFVASAFVALGGYYLTGISNSNVKPNAVHAYELFNYAASYFGDSEAQYRLGRMYLDGQGIARDTKQAVRWLWLAASKGQYQARAVLGALLFKGDFVSRDASRGLMWLMLAQDAATPTETWITNLYNGALKQATTDEQAMALVHRQHWIAQPRRGCGEQPGAG
jgi:TPR repeat protein